jgi:hypothetical protein
MGNKQTAVDLLVASLPLRIQNMYAPEIENAKAVEKEQIEEGYLQGMFARHIMRGEAQANKYYNETYGKE